MIDLHIHTHASSDGQHSPREIFEMARRKNLQAIAFADHNSVDHVEEGIKLSREFGIEFLSCLELNTFHNGLDLHLLAYLVDPGNPILRGWLEDVHRKKMDQAVKRMEKLNELRFSFTWEELTRYSGERIPTGSSFLKAILSREENRRDPRLQPYISGHRSNSPYVNFYRDYLRGGKAASVPMEDLSTVEAIQKIKQLGAVPILAHPSDTGEKTISEVIESGLEGLEVYSSYHNSEDQEAFRRMAERYDLLITAGSDFHGQAVKPDVELGVPGGHYDLVARLKEHRGTA